MDKNEKKIWIIAIVLSFITGLIVLVAKLFIAKWVIKCLM